MKKLLALTLIGMTFTLFLAACGSSKGTCDAYSSNLNKTTNADVASK